MTQQPQTSESSGADGIGIGGKRVDEWVLGPEDTPFFTSTVSLASGRPKIRGTSGDRAHGLMRHSSGHLRKVIPRHTSSSCTVSRHTAPKPLLSTYHPPYSFNIARYSINYSLTGPINQVSPNTSPGTMPSSPSSLPLHTLCTSSHSIKEATVGPRTNLFPMVVQKCKDGKRKGRRWLSLKLGIRSGGPEVGARFLWIWSFSSRG